MELIRRVHSMKEVCRQARANGRKVGFVPTMGALHEGHLSLIRRVKELADLVVVSIFVNPEQFGPEEDLDRYPRDLTGDVDLCIAEEVDYGFAPSVEEIYPKGSQTYIEVTELSTVLEGVARPGHFRGVATVVLKLLEIVQPTVAAFGQKDWQQASIIQRMAEDLMLDLEILVLPTVRDEDGVALSSRLAYMSSEEREAAKAIPRALEAAREALADGSADPDRIITAARQVLEGESRLELEYLALVDPQSLESVTQVGGEMILLLAARIGKTRLIDNTMVRQ